MTRAWPRTPSLPGTGTVTHQTRAERRGQESFYFDTRFNKVEAMELDMEQGGGGGKEGSNVLPHRRSRAGDRVRNAKLSLSGQTQQT